MGYICGVDTRSRTHNEAAERVELLIDARQIANLTRSETHPRARIVFVYLV